MKQIRFVLLVLMVILICACGGRTAGNGTVKVSFSTDSMPKTSIKFHNVSHDFGTINSGEKMLHTYKFTNTGANDLIVYNVESSCGCTVPSYSKQPIAAGEEGTIEIIFDSSGKFGHQHKSVKVHTNTEPAMTVLDFVCQVNEI